MNIHSKKKIQLLNQNRLLCIWHSAKIFIVIPTTGISAKVYRTGTLTLQKLNKNIEFNDFIFEKHPTYLTASMA